MAKQPEKTALLGTIRKPARVGEEGGFLETSEFTARPYAADTASRQHASLEVTLPGEKMRSQDLLQGEVLLGRSPECGVHLNLNSVSRKHARIFLRKEEYHIEDLHSTNGTYVNGIRVVKCILRNNDQIELGGVKILFKEERILHAQDINAC